MLGLDNKYNTLAIIMLFFSQVGTSEASDFSKDDTVLECHLMNEIDLKNFFTSLPTKIDRDFTVAFNDANKTVTYVAGPLIAVEDIPTSRDYWEAQIIFSGRSLKFGAAFTRYSGSINRLTGKLHLNEATVFDDQSKNTIMQIEGNCENHKRRF